MYHHDLTISRRRALRLDFQIHPEWVLKSCESKVLSALRCYDRSVSGKQEKEQALTSITPRHKATPTITLIRHPHPYFRQHECPIR